MGRLSPAETEFLVRVCEDGFPLLMLGPPKHQQDQLAALQMTAVSLLERGLVEVYGGERFGPPLAPDEVDVHLRLLRDRAAVAHDAPPEAVNMLAVAQARVVLEDPRNWNPESTRLWFLCTTAEGQAVVDSQP